VFSQFGISIKAHSLNVNGHSKTFNSVNNKCKN
jgi:hypothetical protein